MHAVIDGVIMCSTNGQCGLTIDTLCVHNYHRILADVLTTALELQYYELFEQVANILCAQANSAFYPQRDCKCVVA